jgi:hypothetical protein
MSGVPGKRSAFGFSIPIDDLTIGRTNAGPVRCLSKLRKLIRSQATMTRRLLLHMVRKMVR